MSEQSAPSADHARQHLGPAADSAAKQMETDTSEAEINAPDRSLIVISVAPDAGDTAARQLAALYREHWDIKSVIKEEIES